MVLHLCLSKVQNRFEGFVKIFFVTIARESTIIVFFKKMESYKVEKDIKINLIYRNVIGNYLYSQFARVHLIILYSFCVEKANDTYKRTLRSWEVW